MELSFMEKQEIERRVKTFLEEYGYSFEEDTYVDIVDLVQKQGFIVGNAELGDTEDGFLAIRPDSQNRLPPLKMIGANVDRSLEWKRFIVAHEFAHSDLHYTEGQLYLHRDNKKGKTSQENDADYFAAALLMPQASFKRVYDQLKNEGLEKKELCQKLAEIFKVPEGSISRRISEVNVGA